VVLRGRRTYPDRKYVFLRIQHRPIPQKPPCACWRNSDFRRIGHHIDKLEPARLRHQARFAGKSLSYASLKSYPPYIRPSLQNRIGKRWYISAKHAAHSAAAVKPSLRKMKLKLNRWLTNSPTNICHLFFGPKINFNKT
jgi:hypothetical protein